MGEELRGALSVTTELDDSEEHLFKPAWENDPTSPPPCSATSVGCAAHHASYGNSFLISYFPDLKTPSISAISAAPCETF